MHYNTSSRRLSFIGNESWAGTGVRRVAWLGVMDTQASHRRAPHDGPIPLRLPA